MKRSSFIIIGILLLLVIASVFIYRSKSKTSTIEDESRNFAYKDTAAITRIFIADKQGNQSSLERTPKGWIVNGKYDCRNDAILNLLEVIRNVEVKMSVPKEGKNNVIKLMSSLAIKVEIYVDDELVKQYYVGHETIDSEASFMLLTDPETGKNYKDPYACFIPGFTGFLQPRFIANENEWRDRVVLNYIPPQMRQIKVEHLDAPADSSFIIDLADAKTFQLKDLKGQPLPFDEAKLKQYLVYYQNISYEALITGMNRRLQDSLSLQRPFCIMTIATTDNKTDTYKFYRKQFLKDIALEKGVTFDYDPDRLYLRFDNDREWALIQYYVFGKLLITPSYFMPQTTVKK